MNINKSILNSPIERFTRSLFGKVIERLAIVVGEKRLSFSQVAALHIIDRTDEININDISIRLNLSISATSRLIDDLVRKDLIKRTEVKNNRRAKKLSLSIHGQKFMDNLSIERVRTIELSANSITDRGPAKLLKMMGSKLFEPTKKGKI
jgi:DNA-binding MarR family transcriptional regulator